jgi:alpha-methylacyl-CoA racemase
MPGPLEHLTILEVAGIGPVPHCGMMLADLGARVIRIDRLETVGVAPETGDILGRGKESIAIDLKRSDGPDLVLRLAEKADALIEGFRPGVAERLGIGPDRVLAANPRIVYGRMTGWGQDGPRATTAGHDIDYLAVSGSLSAIGPADQPIPPLNLVADFGGGSMLLLGGLLAAISHAARSGNGQVVDAAMVDGVAVISSMLHGAIAGGWWGPDRASNLLDGGAPFYTTYRCADERFVAVGAIEPQFFESLLIGLGFDPDEWGDRMDREAWPAMRARLASVFATRSRDEWDVHFRDGDACVAPVLTPAEAAQSDHLAARATFVEHGGVLQAAPAPRFSRTPAHLTTGSPMPGADTEMILAWAGLDLSEVDRLRESTTIGGGKP